MPMFSFNVGPPAEPPAVVAFKQAKAAARQRVIELDRLRREAKDKIVEYEAEMAELSDAAPLNGMSLYLSWVS